MYFSFHGSEIIIVSAAVGGPFFISELGYVAF